jgi:DNA-binding XRE family transcriptional regulator
MKITGLLTDDAVLAELGARIAGRRVELQLTQAAVAEQAGIAKRTLERMEAGQPHSWALWFGCCGCWTPHPGWIA